MEIAGIVLLLMFSAFFSSCETAYTGANRIRIKNYASHGNKNAVRALKILENYDKALVSVLVGNNIVNITIASLGTALSMKLFGDSGLAVSTGIITLTVITFGEIIPKTGTVLNPEKIAMAVSLPLYLIILLLTPITFFFGRIKKVMLLWGDKNPEHEHPSVTEEELKYIIDEIREEGVLENEESKLVRSALDLDEITADKALVPRVNVIGAEVNADIESIKNLFLTEMYSRMPVYENNLDNILGIITQKDFFRFVLENKTDIRDIIQKVQYVSELMPVSQVLVEMQRTNTHMVIVKDQHGGTKGLITMEDIMEELFGEIYDEDDEIIVKIQKKSDKEYEVSGDLELDELLETLGLDEDAVPSIGNTVGGFVTELAGHIPEENEELVYEDLFNIRVLSIADNTVRKVYLTLLS